MEKSGEELYKEREKRINDAIQLKVPDRVPFFPVTGYYAAKYAGIPFERAWYRTDRWFEANKKMILDLEPDLASPSQLVILGSGPALEAVDFKPLKWPGHSLSPNLSHQFVEQEYMKENEYDALLSDPSDYAIRTYLPVYAVPWSLLRCCLICRPFYGEQQQ